MIANVAKLVAAVGLAVFLSIAVVLFTDNECGSDCSWVAEVFFDWTGGYFLLAICFILAVALLWRVPAELPPAVRLVLRTVVFLALTLYLGAVISDVFFVFMDLVFDASGDALADINGWPTFVGSTLLAGVIVWRFRPLRVSPTVPRRREAPS